MLDYPLHPRRVFSLPFLLLFYTSNLIYLICSLFVSAITAINAATMSMVEETTRMKKAPNTGLDTRGKHTEPSFMRKCTEVVREGSSAGADVSAPMSAPVTGSFDPARGFVVKI